MIDLLEWLVGVHFVASRVEDEEPCVLFGKDSMKTVLKACDRLGLHLGHHFLLISLSSVFIF
jgi:hypothetical protein